jgi:hypothetical protein
LHAARKADKVVLTWTIPTQTTEQRNIRHFGPSLICRSLNPVFSQCGTPVAQIPQLQPAKPATKTSAATRLKATYTDTLPQPLQQEHPSSSITYAVAVLNWHHRSAGLSNRVQVPLAPTRPPPPDFHAQVTDNGVVLSWTALPSTPEAPGLQHFYRVYRQQQSGNAEVLVGQLPLGATPTQIVDHSFEWEETYLYWATVVTSVTPTGMPAMQVEGENTPAVKVFAHDVFPPGVPSGLQAVASGVGQPPFIDLIWAPVTAPDLAGYNVYRREQAREWVKINSSVVQTPAYRDATVLPAHTYVYSVSSVDQRGNESARSEEASETVPAVSKSSSR